ncbi:SAM-dependent DNA methyltransferase [Candidatus Saccharibacteria bacterium]|nr:SAM-dependent DNA methyltransferase [Candidatus Saccharibacteria bacterium]
MELIDLTQKTKDLIDTIKGICNDAGLGGDANEYKIVTQGFLYKFLNDKFLYEVAKLNPSIKSAEDLKKLTEDEYQLLLIKLGTRAAHLKSNHLLDYLFAHSNDAEFAKLFDNTLNDIAIENSDVFSVHTAGDTEIRLFEEQLIQNSVNDRSQHDITARKLINALANSKFDFDEIFNAGFDFFSTIFEYMIRDYNKDGGGKYAEYYTPHSIAHVMADILVGTESPSNVTTYDPAAGSGTLLMNLAHRIGPDNCTVYSQDMSQKSSNLLRLNLILNGLSHSIDHIVQGNTIREPRHIGDKFDYIVSNPPFKLDFSNDHDAITSLPNVNERFFAGVPNVPKAKKDGMAIYLLFIQHIMYSLSPTGKAAIVVPTGFITAQSGIEKKIRTKIIDNGWLKGVVSMPSNIFATTGTNVSILFLDKTADNENIVLMDASKLGKQVKDGKNQRTILSKEEQEQIIEVFNNKEQVDDLSVVVTKQQIQDKNYSFSAGQYFEVKIEYVDITANEFSSKMNDHQAKLDEMFAEGERLNNEIKQQLTGLKYE